MLTIVGVAFAVFLLPILVAAIVEGVESAILRAARSRHNRR